MADAGGARTARWLYQCPSWLRMQIAADRYLVLTDRLEIPFSITESPITGALMAAFSDGEEETTASAVVATISPFEGRFAGDVHYHVADLATSVASLQALLDLVARLILRADAESRFDTVWIQGRPLPVFGPNRNGHHLLRSATGPSTLWYNASTGVLWPGPGWGETGDSVEVVGTTSTGLTVAVRSPRGATARYRIDFLFGTQEQTGHAYRALKIES